MDGRRRLGGAFLQWRVPRVSAQARCRRHTDGHKHTSQSRVVAAAGLRGGGELDEGAPGAAAAASRLGTSPMIITTIIVIVISAISSGPAGRL